MFSISYAFADVVDCWRFFHVFPADRGGGGMVIGDEEKSLGEEKKNIEGFILGGGFNSRTHLLYFMCQFLFLFFFFGSRGWMIVY